MYSLKVKIMKAYIYNSRANKTISVASHVNWPAVKYAPFQKVVFEGEILEDNEGNWEVYGMELYIIPFSVRWRCTYYLIRPGATSDTFEQIRKTTGQDHDTKADPDYPASSVTSALDQWNIKFNIGQIVRRSEDDQLYVIEGIDFRLMGPNTCRNYYLCPLEERDVASDWKDTYVEDEMFLRESDLHL